MTESREIISPEQLRIQNFARQWEAAHPGKRADEYWDQVALDFAASELERQSAGRGAVAAQQRLTIARKHFPECRVTDAGLTAGNTATVRSWNVGDDLNEANRGACLNALREADALSAHNTAQLEQLLADTRANVEANFEKLRAALEAKEKENSALKLVLASARIGEETTNLSRSQGAGQWIETAANAAYEEWNAWLTKTLRFETPYDASELRPKFSEIIRKHAPVEGAGQWKCAAEKFKNGTPSGGDPVNCDYPFCGCDPSAEKVITALIECGWSKAVSASQSCLGCGSVGDPWIKHEPSGVYLCSRCTAFVRDGMNKAHVEEAGQWIAGRDAADEAIGKCRIYDDSMIDAREAHAAIRGLASPPEGKP